MPFDPIPVELPSEVIVRRTPVADLLRQALRSIEDIACWTAGTLVTADGRMCAVGALSVASVGWDSVLMTQGGHQPHRAEGDSTYMRAFTLLDWHAKRLFNKTIVQVNDDMLGMVKGRQWCHGNVLECMRDALAAAEANGE
jgi:hypothetical protein